MQSSDFCPWDLSASFHYPKKYDIQESFEFNDISLTTFLTSVANGFLCAPTDFRARIKKNIYHTSTLAEVLMNLIVSWWDHIWWSVMAWIRLGVVIYSGGRNKGPCILDPPSKGFPILHWDPAVPPLLAELRHFFLPELLHSLHTTRTLCGRKSLILIPSGKQSSSRREEQLHRNFLSFTRRNTSPPDNSLNSSTSLYHWIIGFLSQVLVCLFPQSPHPFHFRINRVTIQFTSFFYEARFFESTREYSAQLT